MLAFLDPAVALVHGVLTTLAGALEPVAGDASVALALVVLSLTTRALLLPLALRVHAAEAARRAGVATSPFAGLAPSLAQAPVLLLVYRLCVTPVVGGAPNVLFGAQLFGAPLATHLPAVVMAGGVPALVAGAVLLGLVAVAAVAAARLPRGVPPVLRLLPYGAAAVALFTPLALALHLLASTSWAVAERSLLQH